MPAVAAYCIDAALKGLQRGGSERRRECRIRKGFGRHATGIVDVEQAVARADADERERKCRAPRRVCSVSAERTGVTGADR